MSGTSKKIALAIAAVSLVFVLALLGSLQATHPAYASIYPASEAAAAVEKAPASGDAAAAPGKKAASDEAAAAEGETIEDEDVPMSSGLGGAEPVAAGGMSFQWIIVAGIIAVVAFFAASTLRLNKNITKMRDRLR